MTVGETRADQSTENGRWAMVAIVVVALLLVVIAVVASSAAGVS
jgi:hypothetical protein